MLDNTTSDAPASQDGDKGFVPAPFDPEFRHYRNPLNQWRFAEKVG